VAEETDTPFPGDAWTVAERWVWAQNRAGRVADFNEFLHTKADPSNVAHWSQARELTPRFLETVLGEPALRGELTRIGLWVRGAWVRGPLLLNRLSIANHLALEDSRFEQLVDLSEIRAERSVSFDRSAFAGKVLAVGVRVDGDLSFWHAIFEDEVNAASVRVTSDLVLTDARGREADFRQSIIGGQLFGNRSRFQGLLELQGIKVDSDVLLEDAKIQSLSLQDATIGGQLNIADIRCVAMNLQFVSIAKDLLAWGKKTRLAELNLIGAEIAGDATFVGANIRGTAEMDNMRVDLGLDLQRVRSRKTVKLNGVRIDRNVRMNGCWSTGAIEMKWARVGGQVNFGGARIDGPLDLEAAEVKASVFLRDSGVGPTNPEGESAGRFSAVSLKDAKVDGTVYARGSKFTGELSLESLTAGYLWLISSKFLKKVTLHSGTIVHDCALSGSQFEEPVDFSNSAIGGALDLGSQEIAGPRWGPQSNLILRDASATVVRDRLADGSWPGELSLDGFQYSRLGGHADESAKTTHLSARKAGWYLRWLPRVPAEASAKAPQLSARDASWYVGWLSKDPVFSNNSYRQLAEVLAKQGEVGKANSVRYAARERYRSGTHRFRWIGLSALKVTIGYGIGYGYFRSLIWVILLSFAGMVVFKRYDLADFPNLGVAWLFSVDQLLPVVKLYPHAEDIAKKLHGLSLVYLTIHRTLGFILSSFVVAGLSGLTQK
jgi:hypothetical protein